LKKCFFLPLFFLLLGACDMFLGPPTNEDLSPLRVIMTEPGNGQQATGALNVNVYFSEKVLVLSDVNSVIKVKNLKCGSNMRCGWS